MAIYFVDPENGNDGNTGLSFAQRKRSITAITPAAGDSIKVIGSLAPTLIGSATWTNQSKTVTVPANLTANIDRGESAWTAAANVTATTSATRKEGATSSSLAIAAAFTTGQAARFSFAATDFSAFQQVSFWLRTNLAIAANTLELRLCSDAAGTVTVNTIPIPAIPNLNTWTAVTFNNGAALGASIQSVVLQATVDPGTITILLDNILACKAPGNDAITLHSLLGKNSGTETWWAIQSINGTTVLLDAEANTVQTAGRGYYGTTETVSTYKREPMIADIGAAAANSPFVINSNGAVGNHIAISGGWDRTAMTTQNLESWITGSNSGINGIQIASMNYVDISKLSLVRYANALILSGTSSMNVFADMGLNNNTLPISMASACSYNRFTNMICAGNASAATLSSSFNTWTNVTFNSSIARGATLAGSNNMYYTFLANNNGSDGIIMNLCAQTVIKGYYASFNQLASILNNGYDLSLIAANLLDATKVNSSLPLTNYTVFSHKESGTIDNHFNYTDGALIASETGANRRTLAGMAWALSPTSTNRAAEYPVKLLAGRIACVANALVTVRVWVKRTSTSLTAGLLVSGQQLNGVANDITANASGVANTYEQITLTFTPTEAGVIEINFQAYGGTTFTAYFDDMTISQA